MYPLVPADRSAIRRAVEGAHLRMPVGQRGVVALTARIPGDGIARPRREALGLALEARALDAREHGFTLAFDLDLGLDLPEGRRDVEFAADAKARDAFEHEVEASLVECLDIADPPDATDIVERGRR